MKKIVNIWMALLATTILLLAGCTDSFHEINTDPDALSEAPFSNMLGDMIRETGTTMGGEIEGYGTWAGYVTKIQYLDYMNSIIPTNNTYGNRWRLCYVNNSQGNDILTRTEDDVENFKNIRSAVRIWQQFMWQYLLDGWRDIPYSEALQGGENGVLTPKYDKQEDVYPAVMANLKEIADGMAAGFGSDRLGDGDFIYAGDMKKWQKFCNSLRLRMAMRISGVSPALAKSTIEEICGNPEKYPYIDSHESATYLWWQGSAPYFEPWFDNRRTRDDHGLSDIFIDHLKAMDDPRLPSLAHPAESDGEYRGFPNGPATQPQLTTISRIGAIYRDDPTGFTPFFKACESYFIIAEAAMLGWSVGMTAQEAYEKGVMLSMTENGVSDADAKTYLAGKGKWNNTKERIWEELWIGLFKDNFEAWCLYRRTGTPTTNYPAIESVWKGTHNDQPFRLPYPNNEYLYNPKNVEAVANANVKDHCWGQQMWWDIRTGVK